MTTTNYLSIKEALRLKVAREDLTATINIPTTSAITPICPLHSLQSILYILCIIFVLILIFFICWILYMVLRPLKKANNQKPKISSADQSVVVGQLKTQPKEVDSVSEIIG
jgi:hypothetical protein